jgi:hypothetical protein
MLPGKPVIYGIQGMSEELPGVARNFTGASPTLHNKVSKMLGAMELFY